MNNQTNYPEALLKSRTYNNFVTIPQTTINEKLLHEALAEYAQIEHLMTKLEEHADKGRHIHILVKFKQQVAIKQIHNIIFKQQGEIKGTVDYQKVKKYSASMNYISKEETSVEGHPVLEYGTAPTENQGGDRKSQSYTEAIAQAQQGDVIGAMETIRNCDPVKYLQYKQQYAQNLTTENQVRKKYTAPDFSKDSVKLNTKQQQVWDLLQGTPKTRRIIWVSGDYGSGKSFLYNYIKANHEYGMFDAGQSASFDNVAFRYDEEGVIAWDLPRTFNFTDLTSPLASVIEKFSDFGQSISSMKYSGKTQKVLGHVVVFSNSKPLEQLAHRDVIHIDLTKQEEPEERSVDSTPTQTQQIEEPESPKTVSTDIEYIHGSAIYGHLQQFIHCYDGVFYVQGVKRRFQTEQEAMAFIISEEERKQTLKENRERRS